MSPTALPDDPTAYATACLALVARLIGVATLLQALELWPVRSAFGAGGIWDWRVLRRAYASSSSLGRALLDITLARVDVLLVLRAVAAGTLMVAGATRVVCGVAGAFALLASVALSVRQRGRLNGGSDAMTHLVLIGVVVGSLGLPRAGLAFIAAQVVLAYGSAGVAKLRVPAWRRGRALAPLLSIARYRTPQPLQRIVSRRVVDAMLCAAVLAWELAFGLALVDVRACGAFLVVGVAFHVANFVAFGLQRFVWAFVAGYPAVWWACSILHAS